MNLEAPGFNLGTQWTVSISEVEKCGENGTVFKSTISVDWFYFQLQGDFNYRVFQLAREFCINYNNLHMRTQIARYQRTNICSNMMNMFKTFSKHKIWYADHPYFPTRTAFFLCRYLLVRLRNSVNSESKQGQLQQKYDGSASEHGNIRKFLHRFVVRLPNIYASHSPMHFKSPT